MENVLFLQSDMKAPYEFYARMRHSNPVYYDEQNKIWAVYTYKHCETILKAGWAHIPPHHTILDKHKNLHIILNGLARLSNGAHHHETRAAAMHLLTQWKDCDVPGLIHQLLGESRLPATIDWVNSVAKRLPAFSLLRGFNIPAHIALLLLPEITNLVKLLAPVNIHEEAHLISDSIHKVQDVFDEYVAEKIPPAKESSLYFANFIGLLIQSYDAGRGLLSHAMTHMIRFPESKPISKSGFVLFVRESARLEATVHNTRRVIQQTVQVGNCEIRNGEQVLIVLASANRDAEKFIHADTFMPRRIETMLSFGWGIHKCIAENYSIQLTASLLEYLNSKYSSMVIQETELQFESRINVRLHKQMTIKLY